MKIVIATRNEHKTKEIKQLFNKYDLDLISLSEIDPNNKIPDVDEIGKTLIENAYLKAEEIEKKIGLPCLSDDSGLEVDYLNGDPGIYSARYAGEDCSFQNNIDKLLLKLEGVPKILRKASFKTVLAYVDRSLKFDVLGEVRGYISTNRKGKKGFGYDPIFVVNELNRTYASLSSLEKSKISHRSRAVKNILVKFRKFDIIK